MGAVCLLVGVCLMRVMVVLGPYPFKSPQSSVAALCKLHVGGALDLWCRKVVWQSGENSRPDQTGDLVKKIRLCLFRTGEGVSLDAKFSVVACHQVGCHLLLC